MSSSNQNNTPLQHHHILRNAGIALVLCVLIVVIVLKVTEDSETTDKPKDTEKPKGTTTSAPSEDEDTGDNDGEDTPGDGDDDNTDKDKTDEDKETKDDDGEDTSPPLPDDYFTDTPARIIYGLGIASFVCIFILWSLKKNILRISAFVYSTGISIVGFVLLGFLITIPILIATFKSYIWFWVGYLIFMILLFMSGGRNRRLFMRGTMLGKARKAITDFLPYLIEGIQGIEYETERAAQLARKKEKEERKRFANEAEEQIKRGTVENRINTFENNE